MRFPDQAGIEEIPKDWHPPSIGSSAEVKADLKATFPEAEHVDGQTTVQGDGLRVEFIYGPCEKTDESVKAIHVRSNADPRAVPILKSVSETFNCRLLDLHTGEFGDFGERTEASMKEFVKLCLRKKRERWWTFSVAVVVVATIHVLQDSGKIPAIKSLSKPAIGAYGFFGLILLNVLAFLSSIFSAIRQVGQLKGETESVDEQERLEEAILVPTFQGQGIPPSFVTRFLHIPIAGLFGMIAGSVLAWAFSLVFF